MKRRTTSRSDESGFAMLLVFAMAAAMAWVLYTELPRLAFEAQRNQEELLIERGEQYVRAIEVFQRKNNKLPQNMEELERTNGIRFLRQRYADPLTGKDEWRLIHATNGQLTDSLVKKKKGEADGSSPANPYAVGSTMLVPPPGSEAPAAGGPRRASEMPGAPGMPGPLGTQGAPGAPPAPGAEGNPQPGGPEGTVTAGLAPGVVPGMPGSGNPPGGVPGGPPRPGQNAPGQANAQAGGQVVRPPNQIGSGYTFGSGYSGSPQPVPTGPVDPSGMQQGGFGSPAQAGGAGMGTYQGAPPAAVAGGVTVNPATDMIRRLLTSPNPQGMAAAMGQQNQAQTSAGGTGIVGVASKVDREGIKIYNERTNYKEWEFLYDPAKKQGGGAAGPGGPVQPGQPGAAGGPFQAPSPFAPPPAQGGGRGR